MILSSRVDQRAEPTARPDRSPVLWIALLVLLLSLATDLRVLPGDGALGQDFNDFYVAAVAQQSGMNPYDGATLSRIEQRVFGKSSFSNTVASPPAFFVVFRPLTGLTPRQGYLLWLLLSSVLYAGGLRSLCSLLGIRPGVLIWALALSPPVIIGAFLGQISMVLVAVYIWAIGALLTGRPWRAGLLLALTLVKPHVLLVPDALLCALCWRRGGRTALLATLLWAGAITAAALPFAEAGSVGHWLHALFAYGNTFDHWQPDLSSLAGLYIPFVSHTTSRALSILAVGSGLAASVAIVARVRRERLAPGATRWWLWQTLGGAIWLLVLPYEHPYDATLLLPALAVLLKSSRYQEPTGLALAALTTMICLPELDLMGFRPNITFSYTVIPMAFVALALATHLWRNGRPGALATGADDGEA